MNRIMYWRINQQRDRLGYFVMYKSILQYIHCYKLCKKTYIQ